MKSVQLSALKEYTVVYLGGVAYYVRNRVEVSQYTMSGSFLPLKFMGSTHCHPNLTHHLALCLL